MKKILITIILLLSIGINVSAGCDLGYSETFAGNCCKPAEYVSSFSGTGYYSCSGQRGDLVGGQCCYTPDSITTNVVTDDLNPLNYSTFGDLIAGIINIIFWIGAIAFPLCIIGGGVMMLMSASAGSIANGKKLILYSSVIFGIIILLKVMSIFFKQDLTFL